MMSLHLRSVGHAAIAACVLAFAHGGAIAGPLPFMTEMNKYLVIGTGEAAYGNEFEAFNMSNVEIGADQEIVSTSNNGSPTQRTGQSLGFGGFQTGSSPSLNSIFVEKEVVPGVGVPVPGYTPILAAPGFQRWDSFDPAHPIDTVGVVDRLPGARPIYEGIDYSGNVALTGARANFGSSNSDVNANIGIQCNRASGCFPSPSSENSYFAGDGDSIDPNNPGYNPFDDVRQDLNAGDGVSQFDPTALIGEMKATRDFVVGLQADATFTQASLANTTSNDLINRNIKEDGAPLITNLDAIDNAGNDDGIAVIDIDFAGVSFLVNNTDWILNTVEDTLVIFRMKAGNQFDFTNSSISMGDCNLEGDGSCVTGSSDDVIDELGAIFFMDADQGTNELFNLNNVILGGIALWDFTDFNPNRTSLLDPGTSVFDPPTGNQTVINLNSQDQGCAQFISHQVLMSNNRWNRCAFADMGQQVSEPSSLAIASLGLLGLGFARRWRRRTA